MSLRRVAGVVAAVAVASGAGLLLSSSSGAATTPPPPTPVTLDLAGMVSPSCPTSVPVYGSIAFKPGIAVQFKRGALGAATGETLKITPAPNSTVATSSQRLDVPAAGATPISFTKAATYQLRWDFTAPTLLGGSTSIASQVGKLTFDPAAQMCVVVVQVPVPSASVSGVPAPVTSTINGAVGGLVSAVNGALGPVNGVVGSLPTGLPPVPGLPGVPGAPPGPTARAGADGPGTTYKPTGPTVADRTMPKGYGSGSGLGGSYVSTTGGSINAPAQGFVTSDGKRSSNGSTAAATKSGGSPRTVDLAANRPRAALGALPTLAVIVAILALSGATAFYARTFLLQPAAARVKT